jgi:histone arginine demethylase JMJD6
MDTQVTDTQVTDTQAAPHYAGQIERRANLSYAEFSDRYQYANRPVIVTDALRKWKAISRWTPEFFRTEFADMKFEIEPGKNGAGYGENRAAKVSFTMRDFIDRVLASSDEDPAPYFRNRVLSDVFPMLKSDIEPMPEYCLPNWLLDRYLVKRFHAVLNSWAVAEIFIGGWGGTFPVLHYDHGGLHTFLMQIHGRKNYVIFSPDQTRFMYPTQERPNHSAVNSVFEPDLRRFPLFAQAVPISFVLEPGEMMFLPSCWWHTAKMLTPSITLSINTLNHSNWHALVNTKRSNPLVAAASRVYLTGAGAWRAWRDRDWNRRGRTRVQPGVKWYV